MSCGRVRWWISKQTSLEWDVKSWQKQVPPLMFHLYVSHLVFDFLNWLKRKRKKEFSVCMCMGKRFSMFQFSSGVKRALVYIRLLPLPLLMLMVYDDSVDGVHFMNHLSCFFYRSPLVLPHFNFAHQIKYCAASNHFLKNEKKTHFIIFSFIVVDKWSQCASF